MKKKKEEVVVVSPSMPTHLPEHLAGSSTLQA